MKIWLSKYPNLETWVLKKKSISNPKKTICWFTLTWSIGWPCNQGYENSTYFKRICHTRIVFNMPFEKRFMRSKMWDPVGTRFLILRNKPSYFNFAFAWRKKNQKSGIINQKSDDRILNQNWNNKPRDFNFELRNPKSKIQNQISNIKYRN